MNRPLLEHEGNSAHLTIASANGFAAGLVLGVLKHTDGVVPEPLSTFLNVLVIGIVSGCVGAYTCARDAFVSVAEPVRNNSSLRTCNLDCCCTRCPMTAWRSGCDSKAVRRGLRFALVAAACQGFQVTFHNQFCGWVFRW